jgi:hypothetical protein
VQVTVLARAHELAQRRVGTVDTLERLGHDVRLVADADFGPGDEDLVWASGSATWFPRAWRRLVARPRPSTVLWHTEPLPLPSAAGARLEPLHLREVAKIVLRDARRVDPRSNVRALRRLLARGLPDVLVVSTLERQEFLAERGVDAAFAPLGYHPSHGRDLGLTRDIDVLFLGAVDVPRRRRILGELARAGVDTLALGDWRDPALWGDRRTELLNRTKVLLNLTRHPRLLSGGRMLLGMANKALVLAEPIYQPAPYRPGVHFVSAPLDGLADAVAHYLEHEDERRAIADAAYEFVTGTLTLERSVRTILELVEARR